MQREQTTSNRKLEEKKKRKETMLARLRITTFICYALFAFALLAAATPAPGNMDMVNKRWGTPTTVSTVDVTTTITVTAPASTVTAVNQCTTGPIQCCQGLESVCTYFLSSWKSKEDLADDCRFLNRLAAPQVVLSSSCSVSS